jgi:putative transposase
MKHHRPFGGTQGRRSIRLRGYDYSQAGAYFVTVCAYQRQCLFGAVIEGQMVLNEVGKIAQACWNEIPAHFPRVELDAFVVMPNHVHGIIVMMDAGRGTACRAPTAESFGKPVPGSLPTIVRSFKSAVTRRINQWRTTPGQPVWQRNYFEHIVRNESALDRIRGYIETNPARWALDRENPRCQGSDDFDPWLETYHRTHPSSGRYIPCPSQGKLEAGNGR